MPGRNRPETLKPERHRPERRRPEKHGPEKKYSDSERELAAQPGQGRAELGFERARERAPVKARRLLGLVLVQRLALDDLALDAVWLVAWAKRRLGGAGRARSGRSAARWRSGSPSSCLYGMSTA